MVAETLPLAGFGSTDEAALADLKLSVAIWCQGLQRQGLLMQALSRACLDPRADGSEDLEVVVQLVSETPASLS